jgi:hypothetical protein
VRFTYLPPPRPVGRPRKPKEGEPPPPPSPPESPGERFKEIMILNPKWQGKAHGIDLKVLTPAQREVLDALFDPEKVGEPHRLPLVEDIRKRMDVLEEIKNPVSFYAKLVKPLLLTLGDCYRTYWPARMSGVTVVQRSAVRGDAKDPTPELAKRTVGIEPSRSFLKANRPRADLKAAEERAKQGQEGTKPVDRLELIRQRQAALKAEKERQQGTTAAPPVLDRQGRLAAIKARAEKVKRERPR